MNSIRTRGKALCRCAAAALALFAAACQDDLVAPLPRAEIVDGAHNNGNQHFYFLPPMVRHPAYSGSFDPTLAPEVTICEWTGSACGAVVAEFSTTAGHGSEIIRMEPGSELYIVNWHTRDDNLDATKTYRIRVLVGTRELGHADVDVVNSGRELKNVNTNEFIALLDDRTLPIKFRIEEGAIPPSERGVVAAGYYHTCALGVGGVAYCWGYNAYGQLGNGSQVNSSLPVAVSGGHSFTALATGANHSCGLKADGTTWCWGYGGAGSLGNGSFPGQQTTPVQVTGGQLFAGITSGAYQVCGWTAAGAAWCWGYNYHGQLGIGSSLDYYAQPLAVSGGHAFQSLSGGEYFTCGITTGGAAYCWGYNYHGQVGNGTTTNTWPYAVTIPTAASGSAAYASMAVGGYHACALQTTGAAWCWGYNGTGAVGNGTTTTVWPYGVTTPAPVSGGHAFAGLAAGEYHSCGLKSSGAAWCWGYNPNGQLGVGDFTTTNQPTVPVSGPHVFAILDAGLYHTCGITVLGSAYCWGYGGAGQLGNGGAGTATTPVAVAGALTFETP